MEDLLASIRKAIDSDLGGGASSTKAEARGTLMRGALREMRVSLDNHERTGVSPEREIAELRGRIQRNAAETPPIPAPSRRFARPHVEPPKPASPARDDFRRIMTTQRPQRAPETPPAPPPAYLPDPPDFRGAIDAEDDFHDEAYVPPPPRPPLRAQPALPPPSPAATFHDPYANTPYGYEEELPPHIASGAGRVPPLLSQHSEAAAAQAFRQLSETLLSRAAGGRALEELTSDLLRGMLKQWLDDNLPGLVERLVREEIQRVVRRGR